jgi:hypothetical protein
MKHPTPKSAVYWGADPIADTAHNVHAYRTIAGLFAMLPPGVLETIKTCPRPTPLALAENKNETRRRDE